MRPRPEPYQRNDRRRGSGRSHRSEREYNIVVLGSGGVGKSCLTTQFVRNVWIPHYDPTIEDSYRKAMNVDGRQVMLEIMDTAGTEQFTAMRELYMKTGQGFLLVFSITSNSSLHELAELRDQIVRIKDDERIPIVLVGNKCDLEDDRAVSRSRAFAVSQDWGKIPYYETSARRRQNVDEVFGDLCRQMINRDMETNRSRRRLRDEWDSRRPSMYNGYQRSLYKRPPPRSRGLCTIL